MGSLDQSPEKEAAGGPRVLRSASSENLNSGTSGEQAAVKGEEILSRPQELATRFMEESSLNSE